MKFQLVSDLHLEYGGVEELLKCWAVTAPVLLMAGDIVEINLLKDKKKGRSKAAIKFLKFVSDNYSKVFWVMGNHEHYFNYIEHTARNAQDILNRKGINNITVLSNTTAEFEDCIVFGTTLWASMKNGDPLVVAQCGAGMNDYVHIKKVDEWLEHRSIVPDDTISLHLAAMRHLNDFIDLETDKQKVVITHHAPSIKSIDEHFTYSPLCNAYYTELFDLIYDSGIRLWVHGHLHEAVGYMINKTSVLCNPRGYYGYDHDVYEYKPQHINI